MKTDRDSLANIDPMDRFRRPMTVPAFVGFFIAVGAWATALVVFLTLGVPKPLLAALAPAVIAGGLFIWFKSRGFTAVTKDGLVVNTEIFRWDDITRVVERHRGAQDSAATGMGNYGGGETFYRHTIWVLEDGKERVVNLPVVQGSDAVREEIASRISPSAFAASTFTTWLQRRTIP